ncbi:hypothetical protein B0O99DRAFT_718277 [Bisporella sp. PMI_857]|nr:hypothetical protein B0O99DRAFT_718277 [Bisporella sp. PMI_857]
MKISKHVPAALWFCVLRNTVDRVSVWVLGEVVRGQTRAHFVSDLAMRLRSNSIYFSTCPHPAAINGRRPFIKHDYRSQDSSSLLIDKRIFILTFIPPTRSHDCCCITTRGRGWLPLSRDQLESAVLPSLEEYTVKRRNYRYVTEPWSSGETNEDLLAPLGAYQLEVTFIHDSGGYVLLGGEQLVINSTPEVGHGTKIIAKKAAGLWYVKKVKKK